MNGELDEVVHFDWPPNDEVADPLDQAVPRSEIPLVGFPLAADASRAVLKLRDWLDRDLPEPDRLMGSLLTKTTRFMLAAETGLGKSNFAVALGAHMAAGKDFLHWRSHRPCKVLYIDGEMSGRLLKKRLVDCVRRLGEAPAGFFALSHEDIDGFAPLNTAPGQECMDLIVRKIGGIDFVIFDNVMSLTAGDMTTGDAWSQTMPLVKSLTARCIGQLWVHHTGHNTSRSYGDKTREWSLDLVGHMEAVENAGTDLSFILKFPKAREREPETRADFQPVKVALIDDQWRHELTEAAARALPRLEPLALKFLDVLKVVLASSDVNTFEDRPAVNEGAWKTACATAGLVGPEKASARAKFSKYRRQLLGAGKIASKGKMIWLV